MFAEIGSKQEQWHRCDAADLWADVLAHELLGGSSSPSNDVTSGNWWDAHCKLGGDGGTAEDGNGSKSIALVCIGGGHYAPRHGDLVRGTGAHVFLGHILPSYTMDFTGDAREWQDCVRAAVEATRKGFSPGTPEVVCHIDKKAFKAPQRDELVRFIEHQLGLRVAFQATQLCQPKTNAEAGGAGA